MVPLRSVAAEGGDINYIRNSVKIVIDAYNGDGHFYVVDPADPIIETYAGSSRRYSSRSRRCRRICRGIFATPRTFSPFKRAQYRAYHMDVPEVFYNREDLWQFPREPAGPDGLEAATGPGWRPITS